MNRLPAGFLAAFSVLFASACASSGGESATTAPAPADVEPPPAAETTAATGGYYSSDQAARGRLSFRQVCAECHTTSEFRGRSFDRKWTGRTVHDLYDQISTTMPDDNPGGLPPAMYADVIAYFLELNRYPAGASELVPDEAQMRRLRLEPPPSGTDKP